MRVLSMSLRLMHATDDEWVAMVDGGGRRLEQVHGLYDLWHTGPLEASLVCTGGCPDVIVITCVLRAVA